MAYSGKTAPNSTAQMDSVAWTPKSPSVKATISGSSSYPAKQADMSRTSSPNAQKEKLFENQADAPTE